MNQLGWAHFVTVAVTAMLVVVCVLLHYEALTWFGRMLKTRVLHHRAKIGALIFAQIGLHIVEIWIFAVGFFALTLRPGFGTVIPDAQIGFLDLVYFSASTFTTLGFGDFVPTGAVRFLCGTEALTGFVLITWSASFTFLEMQRYWGRD